MKCPECGDENNLSSALYCWKCKSPLGEEKLTCPACGNVTPPTWVKCQHCGADLGDRAAAAREAAKDILAEYQDNLAARDSTFVRVESAGRRAFHLLLIAVSAPVLLPALIVSAIVCGGKRRMPPAVIFLSACAVFATALLLRGNTLLPDVLEEYVVHLAGISVAASLLILLRQAQLPAQSSGTVLHFSQSFLLAFSLGVFLTLTALLVLAESNGVPHETSEVRTYSVDEILRIKRRGVRRAALPEETVYWEFSDERPIYRLEKGDGSFAASGELRNLDGVDDEDYGLLVPVHGSDFRVWVSCFAEGGGVSGFLETLPDAGGPHLSKIISELRREAYSGNIHILVCASPERYRELRSGIPAQNEYNRSQWMSALILGAVLLIVSGWMLISESQKIA